MISIFRHLILGLLFVVFSWSMMLGQNESGVDNFVYLPQFGNFDKLEQKGDIAIQLASGGLLNVPFPSVRISMSPIDRFGVGVNYFTFSSANSRFDFHNTQAYVASGDVFYYGQIQNAKNNLATSYRIGFGYGIGDVSRTYTSYSSNSGVANLGIQRYVLETGLKFETKRVGLGLGVRSKYFNFTNEFGFGDIDRGEVEKLKSLVNIAPMLLVDFNARFEFGGEIGRLFFSWDQTVNKLKDEDELIPGFLNKSAIHLGFYIIMNKAINNKNKEE